MPDPADRAISSATTTKIGHVTIWFAGLGVLCVAIGAYVVSTAIADGRLTIIAASDHVPVYTKISMILFQAALVGLVIACGAVALKEARRAHTLPFNAILFIASFSTTWQCIPFVVPNHMTYQYAPFAFVVTLDDTWRVVPVIYALTGAGAAFLWFAWIGSAAMRLAIRWWPKLHIVSLAFLCFVTVGTVNFVAELVSVAGGIYSYPDSSTDRPYFGGMMFGVPTVEVMAAGLFWTPCGVAHYLHTRARDSVSGPFTTAPAAPWVVVLRVLAAIGFVNLLFAAFLGIKIAASF